jgi:hypothetical protein
MASAVIKQPSRVVLKPYFALSNDQFIAPLL